MQEKPDDVSVDDDDLILVHLKHLSMMMTTMTVETLQTDDEMHDVDDDDVKGLTWLVKKQEGWVNHREQP